MRSLTLGLLLVGSMASAECLAAAMPTAASPARGSPEISGATQIAVVVRPARRVVVVRPFVRRPHYGRIVAGVALGAIITATVVGIAPRPPSPDLCWYWSDPAGTRGYWDYC